MGARSFKAGLEGFGKDLTGVYIDPFSGTFMGGDEDVRKDVKALKFRVNLLTVLVVVGRAL